MNQNQMPEDELYDPPCTLLKSTSHIRSLTKKGDRLRSVLVGLQFSMFFLPYELVAVSVAPLCVNLFNSIFVAVESALFVLHGSFRVFCMGLSGYLEATEHSQILEEEVQIAGEQDEVSIEPTMTIEEHFEWWWENYRLAPYKGSTDKDLAKAAFKYAMTGEPD